MRIDKETYFLNIAKAVAQRSTCLRAIVGAIIVQDDTIISTGYNGHARGTRNCCDLKICLRENAKPNEKIDNCQVVHAEVNAVLNVARTGLAKTLGSTMYLHFERLDSQDAPYTKPCERCMQVIINSGISKVVNLIIDRKGARKYTITRGIDF